jgi:hypothetical protein
MQGFVNVLTTINSSPSFQSPFRGEDEDEIFESILNDDILYPVNMAKDAVDLLQKVGVIVLNPLVLGDIGPNCFLSTLFSVAHEVSKQANWQRQERL